MEGLLGETKSVVTGKGSSNQGRPSTKRGLTFKDLATELLDMIFRQCDLTWDPNRKTALPMPALIVALRPQRKQYLQALSYFYETEYHLRYSFGDMLLTGRGFSMIRKISINSTIPARDVPDPSHLASLFLDSRVTRVVLRLSHHVNRGPSYWSVLAETRDFIAGFPKWLGGFRSLEYLNVEFPMRFLANLDSFGTEHSWRLDNMRRYDEMVDSRSMVFDWVTTSTGIVLQNAHGPVGRFSWRAEEGKSMDWSKVEPFLIQDLNICEY